MAKLFPDDFDSAPNLDEVFAQSNTTVLTPVELEPIEDEDDIPFPSHDSHDSQVQKPEPKTTKEKEAEEKRERREAKNLAEAEARRTRNKAIADETRKNLPNGGYDEKFPFQIQGFDKPVFASKLSPDDSVPVEKRVRGKHFCPFSTYFGADYGNYGFGEVGQGSTMGTFDLNTGEPMEFDPQKSSVSVGIYDRVYPWIFWYLGWNKSIYNYDYVLARYEPNMVRPKSLGEKQAERDAQAALKAERDAQKAANKPKTPPKLPQAKKTYKNDLEHLGITPFEQSPNAEDLVDAFDYIPSEWQLTLLYGKKPTRLGWQNEDPLDREELEDIILNGEAKTAKKTGKSFSLYPTGFGLLTGDVSGGVIAIDVDGRSAQKILDAVSKGDLPKTVSWTSGKDGRYQFPYQIPPEHRAKLENFTRIALKEYEGVEADSDEQLEVRYNKCQSALPPSIHPKTGEYKWIDSPENTEVAIAPQWLIDFILSQGEKGFKKPSGKGFGTFAKGEKAFTGEKCGNELVNFLNEKILPLLEPEQIYNWEGHNFQLYGSTLKGQPYGRESQSGMSFHLWQNEEGQWCWQDKLTGCGGGAVQYRWMLKGGEGTPKGKDYIDIVKELAAQAGVEIPRDLLKGKRSNNSQPSDYEIAAKEDKERGAITPRSTDNVVRVNERFIASTPETQNQIKGVLKPGSVTVVIAHKGAAKTNVAKKAQELYPKDRFCVMTPTILLGSKSVGEFRGLKKREDAVKDSTIETANVAFCPESIDTITGKKKIIVVDEASQCLRNLFIGECAKKNRPNKIEAARAMFGNVEAEGKIILFLCADMTDVEIDLIRSFNPDLNINFIFNDFEPEKAKITFLDREIKWEESTSPKGEKVKKMTKTTFSKLEGEFTERILNAVKERQSVFVTTSSKRYALELEEVLKNKCPWLNDQNLQNLLCVTAKNSQKPHIQNANMNLDDHIARNSVQVVIGSPAVSSGVSCKLTKEYAECRRALDDLIANGASIDQIDQKTAELKKIEMNWENLTPWFDRGFHHSSCLTSKQFAQHIERLRHMCIDRLACVTHPNRPLSGDRPKSITETGVRAEIVAKGDTAQDVFKRASVGETDYCQIAANYVKLCEQITNCELPDYEYMIKILASENWDATDRDVKIKNRLKSLGFTIIEKIVPIESPESKTVDLMKEAGKAEDWDIAKEMAATKSIGFDEASVLLNKPHAELTETQNKQLNKRFTVEAHPGLLFDDDSAEGFHYNPHIWLNIYMKQQGLLGGLKTAYWHQHMDELLTKDVKSLIRRDKENGLLPDLSLKHDLHEFFDDVIFKHIPMNDFESEYTGESLKPLFAELREKSKKFKSLFPKVKLLSEDEIEKKGIRLVNDHLLSKFALKFRESSRTKDQKTYKLVQLGIVHIEAIEKDFDIRKMLFVGLEKQRIEKLEREALKNEEYARGLKSFLKQQKTPRLSLTKELIAEARARGINLDSIFNLQPAPTQTKEVAPTQKPLALIPGLPLMSELIPVG